MPIFEYICKNCGKDFEAIIYGAQEPACPKCASTRLEQQLSRFAVVGEKANGLSSTPGPCGSCGDPRGPGACSLD